MNYKQKYLDLRSRFIESIDKSYKLGYENGFNEGINATEVASNMLPSGNEVSDANSSTIPQGNDITSSNDIPLEDENLGAYINELETLVSKGERPTLISLRNVVNKISDLKKSYQSKATEEAETNTAWQQRVIDKFINSCQQNNDKAQDDIAKLVADDKTLSDISNIDLSDLLGDKGGNQ